MDYSGNGYSITLNNGSEYQTTAENVVGFGAMNFNSSQGDFLHAPRGELNLERGSVEVWFNSSQASASNGYLIHHRNGATDTRLYLTMTNNVVRASVGNCTACCTSGSVCQSPASSISTGRLYHAALTWNGTHFKLYLNGTNVATSEQYGVSGSMNESYQIGGNHLASNFFPGKIYDVRFYNETLSDEQILANFENGNYNTIISQETNPSEIWQCPATPFSSL